MEPISFKKRCRSTDPWNMRNATPLARPARTPQRAAGRRLHACPHTPGEPEPTPDRLARQLADRFPRMGRHHRAVAELSALVARKIGLDGRRLHAVVRAAELHDVGKLLVPEAVLNKPGSLTEDELALMRRHAIAGYVMLTESGEPAPVPALVRSSHERWDGGGYPDGLAGEDIPLGSRIITICDAYDAMTNERPYRPARPAAEALAELHLGAGVKYDPCLVSVFATVVPAQPATRAIQ
jgi:two-component system, cell cycle response regulator